MFLLSKSARQLNRFEQHTSNVLTLGKGAFSLRRITLSEVMWTVFVMSKKVS